MMKPEIFSVIFRFVTRRLIKVCSSGVYLEREGQGKGSLGIAARRRPTP
jgi:hypothetical protein